MHSTHEEKVEKFYSHGSEIRAEQDGGFLSFGYWDDTTLDYEYAVKQLLDRILSREKPLNKGTILNVACGYGSETFTIYERLLPNKIIAVDITDAHIEFAQHKAEKRGLSDRISFEKIDACNIPLKEQSVDYIIGVEGPAHFNTREKFLNNAYVVLRSEGVLLLSDILVNRDVVSKTFLNRRIGKFSARHWYMPRQNWISITELQIMLEKIGYTQITIESIGGNVFPGFAKFNMKLSSIRNAIKTRGFCIGISLTFISWLLNVTYQRGMSDYVIIRAVKE
jgi:microcystin synthetase protein McyJ